MPENLSVAICVLFGFIGFAIWALGDAIVRSLNSYPTIDIAFVSTLSAVIILLIFSKPLGGFKKTFTMPRLKWRMARGVCLAISGMLSFVAFSNLPLATAYAIIFIIPMVSKVLSVIVLHEQIRLRSWIISAIGFIGVLIVVRPGMVPINIGTLAAMGLIIFFSTGQVLARWIGNGNQTLLSMALFQYSFITLGTLPFALPHLLEMDLMAVALSVAIGFTAIGGTVFATTAFANAPMAHIAPIHYTQIIWGIIYGIVLFDEYPDIWTICGASIIIAAGLMLIFFSRKVHPGYRQPVRN